MKIVAACLITVAAAAGVDASMSAAIPPHAGSARRPLLGQNAVFTHITIEHGLTDQRVQALAQVTYTNLAAGRYVFRVTASNASGVWSGAGRAIALVVTPPWWRTWWFRALAFLAAAGFATGLYAWRVSALERRRRALEAEIAERKVIEETIRASNRQIRDLAGRLIAAQEAERARVARELHDDVNQQLAALSISLSSVRRRLPPHLADSQPELADLQQQAAAVSETIRHLSHELHPRVLQHAGLVAGLRSTCADFGSLHAIDVAFAAEALDEIPADVALCLYRVAQEALHNVARHADARRVEVALRRSGAHMLELRIADDGHGFDLAEARERGGLGLISIDERVRLVSGDVQIRSTQGKGTELRVRVPVRSRDADTPLEKEDEPTESAARG